jgi:dynactin 1
MFFQRLAYKADLINTVVAQAHGLPDSLNGPVSEVLVGVCEVGVKYILIFLLWMSFFLADERTDIGNVYSL